MMRISVLAVGDETLARALATAGRRRGVRVFGPFPPSVARAAGLLPDVAVVDIDGPAGLGAVADVVETFPGVPVVASASSVEGRVGEVIVRGASGFLPSHDDHDAVVDVLRRAADGEIVIDPEHLGKLVAPDRVPGERSIAALTAREREVLRLIAEGASTFDVAALLQISPATVQSHMRSVLAKLGVHSKVEAVRLAWRAGVAPVPIAT
jgi:DNA-binding NarL/FixJ family response regulator